MKKLKEMKDAAIEKCKKIVKDPAFWFGIGCAATAGGIMAYERLFVSRTVNVRTRSGIHDGIPEIGFSFRNLSRITGKPMNTYSYEIVWTPENFQTLLDRAQNHLNDFSASIAESK